MLYYDIAIPLLTIKGQFFISCLSIRLNIYFSIDTKVNSDTVKYLRRNFFQVKEKGLRPLAVFLAVPYYMSGWILNMPVTK